MKKNYIQPQTAIIKTELHSPLLTTSNMKLDDSQTLNEEGDFLSKRRGSWDIWDDDEEE